MLLGVTLHTNGWAWTVTDAKSLGSNLDYGYGRQTIDGRWVQVTVTWQNLRYEARYVPDLLIVDAQGRAYENDTSAEIRYLPDDQYCSSDKPNPGLTHTCVYLYPLPWSATDILLDYRGDRAALRLGGESVQAQPIFDRLDSTWRRQAQARGLSFLCDNFVNFRATPSALR